MTLPELLGAAGHRPPDEETLRQLLIAAGETPADFRAALEAYPDVTWGCMYFATKQPTMLGRSLALVMIETGAPAVLDAVAYNFEKILNDGELVAALEQAGHLEKLRPAAGKYIRRAFDLLMEDRGDPWGNIAIDRYAKSLAEYIGRLPGPLRDEALKVLHEEGSQRGSNAWQATSASWLEERTLKLLDEQPPNNDRLRWWLG